MNDNYVYKESKDFPGVLFFKKRQTRKERYSWLYQGKGINALAAINQAMVNSAVADGQTGVKKDGVSISFSSKELILDDRTTQVLFYIIQLYTKNLSENYSFDSEDVMRLRYVNIKVADVATLFGLTVRGARKMLRKAIDALYDLSIEWNETEKRICEGKEIAVVNNYKFRLLTRVDERSVYAEGKEQSHVGYIDVALEPDFARYLPTANGIWFSIALYGISPSRHPGAFGIGLKMVLHYRMNYFKRNKNVISVEALLSAASDIPNYEAIKAKGEISRRIICPFIRALDILVEKKVLFKWDFLEPNTAELISVDYVFKKLSYDGFRLLYVQFQLSEYPKIDLGKKIQTIGGQFS